METPPPMMNISGSRMLVSMAMLLPRKYVQRSKALAASSSPCLAASTTSREVMVSRARSEDGASLSLSMRCALRTMPVADAV